MATGSWRIETADAVGEERFHTEGQAIARAWDITPPGGTRPSVFFDFGSAPAPRELIPVDPKYIGEVSHVGALPRPSFEQVGDIYMVSKTRTGYICVAKDNARFTTWQKIKLWPTAEENTAELELLRPWLVRPNEDEE